MARNNRHNVAFVVGSVLGAVAGAAAALWKTPYSGEELRAKLTGGGAQDTSGTATAKVTIAGDGDRSLKDKVLSGVEKTLAPIVGVELGKTANGSGPLGSDIRVNRDVAGTGGSGSTASTSTSPASGSGGVSVSHAADGSEMIGLSQDRVDAEKWAAAYRGVDLDDVASSSTDGQAASTDTSSGQSSTLRHQHTWQGEKTNPWGSGSDSTAGDASDASTSYADDDSSDVSITRAADGSTMIGLSRDKVDADKWAAAYSGEDLDVKDTTRSTSTSTSTTSTTSTAGASSGSAHGYASKAEESAAQTGLGAAPAYPGRDQVGYTPANNEAPDSSVGDVSHGADIRTGHTADTMPIRPDEDAATIEQLTRPQVDRVPDSMRAPTEQGMHPFPKLGGKE